jgi:Protein of unknown function (DUF1006).
MSPSEIALRRLISQQIDQAAFRAPADLVRYMGIIQAQDYPMSQWAVGLRLSGPARVQDVQEAIDRGDIIRTHVLRPTWHLVSREDVHWMTALSAKRILASFRSRHRELGLSEEVIKKSNRLIEQELSRRGHLLREALVAVLENAGLPNENNRASHLLMCAELDGIICSGAAQNGKQTYALLAERVPDRRLLQREEALFTLAERYFVSHGPASIRDFVWWSGLSAKDAREALELVRGKLEEVSVNGETYWFKDSGPYRIAQRVHLLPAYDEFIISYVDRSATLTDAHAKRTIMANGLFRPMVVVDGRVAGTWKRSVKKTGVGMEIILFHDLDPAQVAAIEQQGERFGAFLGKRVTFF